METGLPSPLLRVPSLFPCFCYHSLSFSLFSVLLQFAAHYFFFRYGVDGLGENGKSFGTCEVSL